MTAAIACGKLRCAIPQSAIAFPRYANASVSPIAASSTFSINFGTLLNGTTTLTLSGNLSIGASGVFSRSTGSTTFSGTGTTPQLSQWMMGMGVPQ